MMRLPYDSPEALKLSTRISETIYYAALKASVELAKKDGPYPLFDNSDFSKGILQFDYYNKDQYEFHHDFQSLKKEIMQFGTRNSLLTSIQPTASVSQISMCYESCEPQ